MQHQSLEHRFARTVPRELEPGVLYVSMEYATAVHSCCCGCEERVVTPFTPTDWKMTFDGETISLYPSIGNWQFRCQSHYVICEGRVVEVGRWTSAEVAGELRRDQAAKQRYYERSKEGPSTRLPTVSSDVEVPPHHGEELAQSFDTVTQESVWKSMTKWILRLAGKQA